MVDKETFQSTKITQTHRRILSVQLAEHRNILMLVDGVLALVALLLGLWFGAQRSGWVFSFELILAYSPWFAGLTILYFVLATANDAYRPKVAADSTASFIALGKTVLQIFVLYLLIYSLLPPYSLPRHFIGFFTLISPFLLLSWRRVYSLVFVSAFRRRAVVVGAGWGGKTIAKTLKDFAPSHFEFIGFVDDDPTKQQSTIHGVPVIGSTSSLPHLAHAERVTDDVVALTLEFSGTVFCS